VEKPIAADMESAARLVEALGRPGVCCRWTPGALHPAVLALEERSRLPLFFEVHRLSVFSPRSLDVDVVLDLMIQRYRHRAEPDRNGAAEIRAAASPSSRRKWISPMCAWSLPMVHRQPDGQPGLHGPGAELRLFSRVNTCRWTMAANAGR